MKKSIALGFAALLVSAVSTQAAPNDVFTNFTIPADTTNTATFSIIGRTLGVVEQLSLPGFFQFNVAYQFFNPTVSGSYSLGIADANYDPVLIVYSGQTSFPTSSPGSGAIGLNDDGDLLNFNGLAISNESNSIIMNLSLTAGTNYLVAATSYEFASDIPLPLTFFVYGPGQVAVGGNGAIPEPSSYAAILGGLVLAAVGARRRKRAV